jgi:rhodanese-related sulfurtransferase
MEFLEFLARDFNWGVAIVFLVSGALLVLWLPLQNRFAPSAGVTTLEATRLINAGGVVVIDVRDAAAYTDGHLGKAINIPLAELRDRLPELRKKASKNILVYCDRGQKSLSAAKVLAGQDKVIHNLKGGLEAWKEAGLPVEKTPEKASKKAEKPDKSEKPNKPKKARQAKKSSGKERTSPSKKPGQVDNPDKTEEHDLAEKPGSTEITTQTGSPDPTENPHLAESSEPPENPNQTEKPHDPSRNA